MNDVRLKVIEHLKNAKADIGVQEATIGIDAFVDKIDRVIQSKPLNEEYVFFRDIAEFGNHILSKSGKSCAIELNESFTKLGGNAPIMANAVGTLGIKVNCIGALGYPEIDPSFYDKLKNCTLYSIGNPGYTTALEFEDGKIMLSQRDSLNKIDWNEMKNHLEIENIEKFFNESKLIGLLNWTGMMHFNNILKGVISEILPLHKPNKDQIVFFDLADFSDRTKEDIQGVLDLMNQFAEHYKVILGLNENEAVLLYNAINSQNNTEDWMYIGTHIYDNLKIDALVIHTLKSSMVWYENGTSKVDSLFVKKPKLSTGGGDNFNAGLCFGQLAGLDYEGSLYCANGTSGYYVRNAQSPTLDDLIHTLENWEAAIETP